MWPSGWIIPMSLWGFVHSDGFFAGHPSPQPSPQGGGSAAARWAGERAYSGKHVSLRSLPPCGVEASEARFEVRRGVRGRDASDDLTTRKNQYDRTHNNPPPPTLTDVVTTLRTLARPSCRRSSRAGWTSSTRPGAGALETGYRRDADRISARSRRRQRRRSATKTRTRSS